jgi:hypothetical protein
MPDKAIKNIWMFQKFNAERQEQRNMLPFGKAEEQMETCPVLQGPSALPVECLPPPFGYQKYFPSLFPKNDG